MDKTMKKLTTRLAAFICVYLYSSAVTNTAQAEDWPIWGRDASRNMVAPDAGPIPHDFAPGEEIGRTGKIDPKTQKHIKWIAKLGSQAFDTIATRMLHVLLALCFGVPYLGSLCSGCYVECSFSRFSLISFISFSLISLFDLISFYLLARCRS